MPIENHGVGHAPPRLVPPTSSIHNVTQDRRLSFDNIACNMACYLLDSTSLYGKFLAIRESIPAATFANSFDQITRATS